MSRYREPQPSLRELPRCGGDEQGSASLFSQLRADQLGSSGYTAVNLSGAAVRTQVRQLAPKYDDVVIDVGGRDTGSLRAALLVSDAVLIPVQPRSFDIWALDQVAALVKEARELNPDLRALAFLNGADAQGVEAQPKDPKAVEEPNRSRFNSFPITSRSRSDIQWLSQRSRLVSPLWAMTPPPRLSSARLEPGPRQPLLGNAAGSQP